MIIVKSGVVPKPRSAWWAERLWVCDSCGCEFTPEMGDSVTSTRAVGPFEGKASCPCPTCGRTCIEYYEGAYS